MSNENDVGVASSSLGGVPASERDWIGSLQSVMPGVLGVLYYLFDGSWDDALESFEDLKRDWESNCPQVDDSNFQLEAFRVLYRQSVEKRRAKKPFQADESRDSQPDCGDKTRLNATTQENEKRRRLRDAILSIPFDERAVFLLHENGGLTYEEIATILDANFDEVKTKMRRALNHLILLPSELQEIAPCGGDFDNPTTDAP